MTYTPTPNFINIFPILFQIHSSQIFTIRKEGYKSTYHILPFYFQHKHMHILQI